MPANTTTWFTAFLLIFNLACSSGCTDGGTTSGGDTGNGDDTGNDNDNDVGNTPPPPPTARVPGDFADLQQALDAASSGDVILLAPGTYTGPITLGEGVMLVSDFAYSGDASAIGSTIVDGGGAAAAITIPAGMQDRPTLNGITIQNAGDGILPFSRFNLLNCLVRDTSDGLDYEDGSGGLVRGCTFESNSDDGIDLDNAVDVLIEDNLIRDNGDDGIEIRMQAYNGPTLNVVIRNNRIQRNSEDGIQLIHYDVLTNRLLRIEYNTFEDNAFAGIGMMDGANTTEDFRAASIPEPIYIFNNTFVANDHGITGGDNTVVVNNLFVGHATLAVKNVDANSALAFNLFFNNASDNADSNVDAGSTLLADPLLDANLVPSPGSPAIDAGTAAYVWQAMTVLDLAADAYSGNAPDIGALESP